jgi:adenylate cyclase
MERKLAAILYADVVGYSRLTGADEKGTHESLKTHLGALTEAITNHGGRIVNTAGDAVLADFASVVTALECAVAAQREMAERDQDVPAPRKLQFRIGVNLGDIIVDGEEIYGNGVNVAARLETLADPGGICISGRVLEQVKGNIDVGFASLGAQKVKNIETPVNAYKVRLDPADAGKTIELRNPKAPAWPWPTAVAVALAIVALAGFTEWMRPSTVELQPAAKQELAYPSPGIPSIAVLPFDNLSGDPGDQFLADGLTEDIITTLSRVPDLLIIARNSTFTYKGKPVKVQQVAKELGVRYVLEGSVQRSGDRLRVTAQFIDAITGNHLWADRFDRKVDDIFAVQDDISRKVLIELQVKLTTGENIRVASRGTKSLEAWLLRVQAYAEGSKYNKEGMLKARELYRAAVEADPLYVRAWGGIAWTYWWEARMGGWTHSRDEALNKGVEFAERAIKGDPNDPIGYIIMSYLLSLMGENDRAIGLAERAMAVAPGDFLATAAVGVPLVWAGQPERATEFFEKAKRLSPKYPPWIDWMEGVAQLIAGRPEDALPTLRRGVDRAPSSFLARGRLAAGYAALNRRDQAKAESAELLKIRPDMTATKFAKLHPFKYSKDQELIRDLLVKAGLPKG